MAIDGVSSATAGQTFQIYGTHNDPIPGSLQCTISKPSDPAFSATGLAQTVSSPSTQFSFQFTGGLAAGNYESHVNGSATSFGASLTVS